MTPKRGLIVGAGSAGIRHAQVLEEIIPTASHLHVPSRNFDRWWAGLIGRRGNESLGIDFAIIASPSPMHRSQALALAEKSIPVLIEKPVTSNLEDAKILERSLNELLVPAQVGYVLRHAPGFRYFSDRVNALGLEDVSRVDVISHSYLPDWRNNTDYRESVSAQPELGGGVLLELSHDLDYAGAIFGDFDIISAKTSKSMELAIGAESSAEIEARLKNGSHVNISLDMWNRNMKRFCEVSWADGTLVRWDILNGTVLQVSGAAGAEKIESFSSNRDDWFQRQFEHFLNVLDNSYTPVASVKEAAKIVRLVETIRKRAGVEL